MSTELIGREIARFLGSSEPEVLCLRGAWGVGKTFLWNKLLLEARDAQKIALPRYAYVSLFGTQSLDELKASVVTATDPIEYIGQPAEPDEAIKRKIPRASTTMRLLPYLGLLPLIGTELAKVAQSLSFYAVREQLVCLDDLERKSDSLRLKDVLGLATNLRDQQKCKVIIVLNDSAFSKADSGDFNTYFEKAIDSHVSFEPTALECATIALKNEPLDRLVSIYAVKLNISNIRVLMKIRRLALLMMDACGNCSEAVREAAVKSLTLAAFSRNISGAPTLDFLKRWTRFHRIDEQSPAEHRGWHQLLEQYEFTRFTKLDQLLADAVARGYFDDDELRNEVRQLDQQVERAGLEADFDAAWQRYHNSFNDDAEQLTAELVSSYRANVSQISPRNANATVSLLRRLGKDAEVEALIRHYTQNREDAVFDYNQLFGDDDLSEPSFAAAFNERASAIKDDRAPRDILREIAETQGWGRADVTALSNVTADEYVIIFKSFAGDPVTSQIVRTALMLADSQTPETTRMRAAVVGALRLIAGESALNRERVAKFGVPELLHAHGPAPAA